MLFIGKFVANGRILISMKKLKLYGNKIFSSPFALVVLVGLLHLFCKWPGALNPDSQAQYQMAVAGVYNDHHPALMSFVWRYLNYIVPGPGLMFSFQICLLYGAIFYLIISTNKFFKWSIILILLPFIPQIFRFVNVILKDTNFAFSFLFVAAYLSYITLNNIKLNLIKISILFLVLLYGTGVKFQAQYCAPILLIWMSVAIVNYKICCKKFITVTILLLVSFYTLLNGISFIFIPNVHKDYSWQYVKLYDLAVISRDTKQDLLPSANKTEKFTMQILCDRLSYCTSFVNCKYHKYAVDNLVFDSDPILRKGINNIERKELYIVWLKTVVKHPLLYLKHRTLNMLGILLSVPDVFRDLNSHFAHNSILYLVVTVFIYLSISNIAPALICIVYLIFGILVLYKTKNINLFAISLVGLNAVGSMMMLVLFFCSMASTPRYAYISMCMVHASHIFAYLCYKSTK